MADGFKAASSPSTSLCYSSAFSFPAETAATRGLPVFVNSDAKSTTTESEKEEGSVLEAYFQKKLVAFEYAKRVTQVTLQRSSSSDAQPSTLSADILEAWIAESSQLPISWQYADLHPKESPIRSLVVSTIHQDHPPSIEYLSLQGGNGASPTIVKSSLVLKQQQFASDIVPASVNVSIAGEGFHRRFAIDVVVREDAQQRCAEPERKLLLRVPLSHEVYADLDELRVGALFFICYCVLYLFLRYRQLSNYAEDGAIRRVAAVCVFQAHRDRTPVPSFPTTYDRARVPHVRLLFLGDANGLHIFQRAKCVHLASVYFVLFLSTGRLQAKLTLNSPFISGIKRHRTAICTARHPSWRPSSSCTVRGIEALAKMKMASQTRVRKERPKRTFMQATSRYPR